jgi:hypothetical protein
MRENKQLEFLQKNHIQIVKTALENKNKIGYVQLFVDNDFNLLGNSVKFNESDFDKESFTLATIPHPQKTLEILESEFIYYTVLWFDNKTK